MSVTRLFDPITIRGTQIRNRVWISPMCQYSSFEHDGHTTDWHFVHYGVMARGGAGLVMVEATAVTPDGRISPNCLGIWDDEHLAGLSRIVSFAHTQGAAIGIQLAHAGRKGSAHPWMPNSPAGSVPLDEGGWTTVAPSTEPFEGMREPHALSEAELDDVVVAFRKAAQRASGIGFDVIELHAAHGYLLHEFLSPLSNLRDDAYGGSLENRARLLRRIAQAVRGDLPNVPLFVRISATDWVAGGLTLEESTQVARWLSEDGVDLIDVSSGGAVSYAQIPVRPAYQVPLADTIRRESGMLVAAVGMITSAVQADSIVSTGQADAVFVARAALRDPQLGLNWSKELRDDRAAVPDQLWRAY